MATTHDLSDEQNRLANRLLDAFNPAPLVEDIVFDVCVDTAGSLTDAQLRRLVEAAEMGSARRERNHQLLNERFGAVSRG